LELRDELAEGWYDHDWPPIPELRLLQHHGLRTGALVFDIGAHQGIVALIVSRIVGKEGLVIAVEGEPHNARVAERNCTLNDAQNVIVVSAAAAARTGCVRFLEGLNGRVDQRRARWGSVAVPATTIDELAQRYGIPDVVIIDVEGYEGPVLEGARTTLSRKHTTFLVEVHVGHGLDRPPQAIAAYFDAAYRLLAAPEYCEVDSFADWKDQSPVNLKRFYLAALPRAHQ